MTEEFRTMWLEAAQEYSKALEVEDDSIEVISDPSAIDETISMPAVKLDADGHVEKYVQIRFSALASAIANAQATLAQLNSDAETLRATIAELQAQAGSNNANT